MASTLESNHDLVQLIQQADLALVQMEQARSNVDAAKLNFEIAKEDFEKSRQAFDHVIAKADDFGVNRGKLKKLAEERSAALLASGLLAVPANGTVRPPKAAKPARKTKETKSSKSEAQYSEADISSDFTADDESPEAPVFN